MFGAKDLIMEEHKSSSSSNDELLYNFGCGYKRTVVLIDRFIDNPLHELIEGLAASAQTLPIDDPIFEDNLSRAPLLVELRHDIPCHLELLHESIQLAEAQSLWAGPPRICAWLFTTTPLEQIRHEIRGHLNLRYPSGEKYYFRFFDPRVMPHLARIFFSSKSTDIRNDLCILLGCIDIWCHLDFDGKMISYKRVSSKLSSRDRIFRIDQKTADAIDRISMLNLTIKELAKREIRYDQADGCAIDQEIFRAQCLGIKEPEDKIAYAWRAFSQGEKFTTHFDLRKLIDGALLEGQPLECLFSANFSINN